VNVLEHLTDEELRVLYLGRKHGALKLYASDLEKIACVIGGLRAEVAQLTAELGVQGPPKSGRLMV
jgi:hypothetical protein